MCICFNCHNILKVGVAFFPGIGVRILIVNIGEFMASQNSRSRNGMFGKFWIIIDKRSHRRNNVLDVIFMGMKTIGYFSGTKDSIRRQTGYRWLYMRLCHGCIWVGSCLFVCFASRRLILEFLNKSSKIFRKS